MFQNRTNGRVVGTVGMDLGGEVKADATFVDNGVGWNFGSVVNMAFFA